MRRRLETLQHVVGDNAGGGGGGLAIVLLFTQEDDVAPSFA